MVVSLFFALCESIALFLSLFLFSFQVNATHCVWVRYRMNEWVSELVNVYFIYSPFTIHLSFALFYMVFALYFMPPLCQRKLKKKLTHIHTQRETYTNTQNNCCAITLSVLFHFLGLILKLYDRNFSAGQPINVRVLVFVLKNMYRTVCVCLYVWWIHFMRNHKINRNWLVFRGSN